MAWTDVSYGDNLRNGTRGDPVCDVQRWANGLGIWNQAADSYIIRVDGLFGASTEWIVKHYQAYGMGVLYPQDGIVGPKTWAAMKDGVGTEAISGYPNYLVPEGC